MRIGTKQQREWITKKLTGSSTKQTLESNKNIEDSKHKHTHKQQTRSSHFPVFSLHLLIFEQKCIENFLLYSYKDSGSERKKSTTLTNKFDAARTRHEKKIVSRLDRKATEQTFSIIIILFILCIFSRFSILFLFSLWVLSINNTSVSVVL